MSINITTLESSLQSKFNATTSSTDSKDFLLLTKSLDAINSGAVLEVANTGALPTASANTGRVYFVTADTKLYFSNGSAWVAMSSAADITAAVNALVDSAPGALDTLNELAAALGDDANFSTTVTNSLATKAPLASPTFTGDVTLADKIVHTGDTNTAIRFPADDTVTVETGGTERMRIDSSGSITAKRARSNTAGENGIVVSPSDTTVSYGFRIDQTNNNFNFDKVNDGTNIMSLSHDYHVLVGTTDSQPPTNNDASGIALRADGKIAASRANGISGDFNTGADGDIIWFRKAGTVVGKIGNSNGSSPGDLFISSGTSGHAGLGFGGGPNINPTTNDGALSDNTVDLGSSSYHFKDLYLSGGVVDTTTTVSYASSIALSYDNGAIQSVALTGNVTFTDSLADGEAVVLMLDNGASHTVTWTAVTKWVTSGGNVAPTLTANDTIVLWKIGTSVYAAYAGSYT